MTTLGTDDCWLVDLDGVVWLADRPIAGSSAAIGALRACGVRVAFFTNNSFSTRVEMRAKFERHGIEFADEDLLSSSQAAAALLPLGARATVLGGAGIVEALVERGIDVVDLDLLKDSERIDACVVGLDQRLTFDRLTRVCRAINGGATFLATNDDATYPTTNGVLPGGGALVAAVQYATRVPPVVAGKPYPPSVDLVKQVLGRVSVVIGDRPETDGELARCLGARFGIVRSGVTADSVNVVPKPDIDGPDLISVVAEALHTSPQQILASSGLHS
ncbi:MAG TPA: HAD hydrolase-like protein [Acidimicrobiales bacterium]|nr:HAD hydrolase-like protein [Acidimicrobiales bacterium]